MLSSIVKASGAAALLCLMTAMPAAAGTFTFSPCAPDGRIATASRPGTGAPFEIESADDFTLTSQTTITSATFTGLLTGTTPIVGEVVVEIYRIFPKDSDATRTPNVPTRA